MIPSDFKKECSCKKLKASQKAGLHFKEQYDKEVIKNGELFIENTALKQQLGISVEALEQTKTISFWAVGYYNKDDATSDVLEKFERIGTVVKTALGKIKKDN